MVIIFTVHFSKQFIKLLYSYIFDELLFQITEFGDFVKFWWPFRTLIGVSTPFQPMILRQKSPENVKIFFIYFFPKTISVEMVFCYHNCSNVL